MEILEKYFVLQKNIYEFFGYEEDWVVIPLDDAREYQWHLDEEAGHVWFWDKNDLSNIYSNELYRQRFLPGCVFPGDGYTMIVVDTHTDGNKFLQVFDDAKRHDVIPDGDEL